MFSCLCSYLNSCTISTTIETVFCSSIREGADYIAASTRQGEATESKQCFMGVRSVFSRLRSTLESALVSLKKLEEDAKQQEAIHDQSIEENFLVNKASLQQ
jgi:hypothetical protein